MTSVACTVLPGPVQANGSNAEPLTRLTVTLNEQLLTVTLNEQLWLPMLLAQVTVVTPRLKVEPDAGEQVIVPQLPVGTGKL